ncbi:conserved hypothetical protein [Theileria equi strain WA]|uniref:Uncharacterized protein n=1 Tax=Theileria equi strain WA TaxID=1537102 RepID=L1LFT8_THEEQ|nr:conserved hypothetical protein [Theileria equi strain WA]EKX74130.1 conserved hypothetical protein [Theileria equi strain WA]|eukprot:XP_004833582.1 conserved hypothetical protein [Theileria equi strain WA]
MLFMPAEWFFKLSIAKDRVRFLRLYSGASFFLGLGLTYVAHKPKYEPCSTKPSFFYKLHLKRLLKQDKITLDQYERYLDFRRLS